MSYEKPFSKPTTKEESKVENRTQHPVESVVAHTKDLHQLCKINPDSPECTHESCNKIVEEITHSEICDLYERCSNHSVLTFEDIAETTQYVKKILEKELEVSSEEEKGYALPRLKLVSSRASEIRTATNKYIRALTEFFNVRHQRMRLENEDFKDKLTTIDSRRRLAHDTLIGALQEYSKVVRELKDYGFLEGHSVIEWNFGMALPEKAGNGAIHVFSQQFLSNRELVRDWGISANLHEDILSIRKMLDMRQVAK